MRMYATDHNNGNSITATLYSISTTWQESTATWITRTGSYVWNTAGANGVGTDIAGTETDAVQLSATSQWYEWDVKSAVQAWVDGTANNGLKVEAASGDNSSQFKFASSE